MNLRGPVTRLKNRADRVVADARYGVGRVADGRLTVPRVFTAYAVPLGVSALVFVEQPTVSIGELLSGASIVSGVLLGLCTLSFNRVKDLAEDSNTVWFGVDPMRAAYRFARNTLSAAYVSVFVTGLLIAELFVKTGLPARISLAVTIGLVTHLGVRIWFLLSGIRHQVESVAGQRSTEPPRLRNAS
jgi:hypothetical protein